MKALFLLGLLVCLSCSSDKKQDWDSGAARENAFQQEGAEERDAATKDQFPDIAPATNQSPSK